MPYVCNTCRKECGECGELPTNTLKTRLRQSSQFIAIVRAAIGSEASERNEPWVRTLITEALKKFDEEK